MSTASKLSTKKIDRVARRAAERWMIATADANVGRGAELERVIRQAIMDYYKEKPA